MSMDNLLNALCGKSVRNVASVAIGAGDSRKTFSSEPRSVYFYYVWVRRIQMIMQQKISIMDSFLGGV